MLNPSAEQKVQESDTVCMKVEVRNFGPIRNGTVSLKPLTILVGPNGCGKSHIATLIHSIAAAESDRVTWNPLEADLLQSHTQKTLIHNEAGQIMHSHMHGNKSMVYSSIYETIVNLRIETFKKILERNFSRDYKELIKTGENISSLDISSKTMQNVLEYVDDDLMNSSYTVHKLKIEFKEYIEMQDKQNLNAYYKGNELVLDVPKFCDRSFLVSALNKALKKFYTYPKNIERSIYFPAGRIGLMLAHGPIVSDYYRRISSLDDYSPRINLQGTNVDFLAMLVEAKDKKGNYADHASVFEKALEGRIAIVPSLGKSVSIEFEQHGKKIPLFTAQSSVQDLAALLIYLKHISRQNDLLILEEPEISLHPRMQIHLARLIARLINGGLYVLVSTHSPYFMEQLGHCVLAGSSERGPGSSKFPVDERLHSSNVAAYGFVRNGDGYDVKQLSVDENGIDQSEFVDEFSKLYDELVDLNFEEK